MKFNTKLMIKKIEYLDEETKEAFVTLTDGDYELTVFAYPFIDRDGLKLSAFLESDIMVNENCSFAINNSELKSFDGRLTDRQTGAVEIGGFVIYIQPDWIPGDIKSGDYISFNCSRVDLF